MGAVPDPIAIAPVAAPPVRRGHDTGAVTAELALGLSAVVAVLVAAILTLSAGITQLRCADAARAGARAAAVGAEPAEIRRTVLALAGQDAAVRVDRSGEWVVVRVERALGSGRGWGFAGLTAAAEARAWVEPTATGLARVDGRPARAEAQTGDVHAPSIGVVGQRPEAHAPPEPGPGHGSRA